MIQNILYITRKNHINVFFYLIVSVLSITITSCTKTSEYIYCADIDCSYGQYIIKEKSKNFQFYIKDSINYRVEIKENEDFSEEAFLTVDVLMDTKDYLTEVEKNILRETITKTEYIKGGLVEEYVINYIYDFKNLEDISTYKTAYTKWKSALLIPVVDGLSEREDKFLGVLDTLKNATLIKKLIYEDINHYTIKKNNFFYYTKSSKRINELRDTVHIIFPKPIKSIKNHNSTYKLSEDRKTLTLFDSIYGKKNKKGKYSKLSIDF